MSDSAVRLSRDEAAIVRNVLQTHLPDREVWVFGSRIGANCKPYSDLDLLVRGESLPSGTLAALKEAFEESNLPFQVDIVEWASTSETFRRIIEEKYVVLQSARQ